MLKQIDKVTINKLIISIVVDSVDIFFASWGVGDIFDWAAFGMSILLWGTDGLIAGPEALLPLGPADAFIPSCTIAGVTSIMRQKDGKKDKLELF